MISAALIRHYNERIGFLSNLKRRADDEIERHELDTELEWTRRRLHVMVTRVGNVHPGPEKPELSEAPRESRGNVPGAKTGLLTLVCQILRCVRLQDL